jgi:hypothetical protein
MPSVSTSHRSLTVLLFTMIISGFSAWGQAPPPSKPFGQAVQTSAVASKPSKIKGGDWDDKTQKVVITAKFANKELQQSYEGYKATISLLGESASDSKVKKVLLQESVPISLEPGKAQEHICAEVVTQFDKTGAKFGYFYDCWIIVVKDKQGKIVQVNSSSMSLEKYTELAAKLQLGKTYSPKLLPVPAPRF